MARPKTQQQNKQKRPKAAMVPTLMCPSRGSKNHYSGQCRPCLNLNTPEGCQEGASCNFCHCEHNELKLAEAAMCSMKAQAKKSEMTESAEVLSTWSRCTTDFQNFASVPKPYSSGQAASISPPLGTWRHSSSRSECSTCSTEEVDRFRIGERDAEIPSEEDVPFPSSWPKARDYPSSDFQVIRVISF
jgi:hypothetical protein